MVTKADTPRHLHPDAISLRQIRYFVEVARSGSLTAASRALRVSQPAIGQQIKLLEAVLGVELFERHSRGVALSEAGKAWLPHADCILTAMKAAHESALDLGGNVQVTLRLGVTPSLARSVLPPLLHRSTLPDASLHVDFFEGMSHQLADLVTSGHLDAAFGYQPVNSPGVTSLAFADEALCVVGPLSTIGEGTSPFPVERMAELPLVLGRNPNRIRSLLETALDERGLQVAPKVELDLAGLKRDFLIGSDYCVVSPRGLFLADIREGRLGGRPIDTPLTCQRIHLMIRESLRPDTARALIQMLWDVVQQDLSLYELCWTPIDQQI